jgi:hypothetical protein
MTRTSPARATLVRPSELYESQTVGSTPPSSTAAAANPAPYQPLRRCTPDVNSAVSST